MDQTNFLSIENFLFAQLALQKQCLTREELTRLKTGEGVSLARVCLEQGLLPLATWQAIVQEGDQLLLQEIVRARYLEPVALAQTRKVLANLRRAGRWPTLAETLARESKLSSEQMQHLYHRLATLNTSAEEATKPLLEVGSLFGGYRIERELGRGGMGAVYQAHDTRLGRTVALKIALSGDEDQLRRFMQEARATAALNHPQIIRIFEVGETPQPYFTMEYLQGVTLAERIRQNQIKPREAAVILQKVADALQEAHQRSIIHRDLKPGNIMIDVQGEPKVMDFGLAKVLNTQGNLSLSGTVVGTPAYMSPEQAQGKAVDARSDVYSLGVTLYEILTGRPPFQGESFLNMMVQIVERDPVPPRQWNPDLPVELEAICLKCLEKLPQKRYVSARMLSRDLRNFLDHRSILARPATRLTQVRKWILRHQGISALAVGLLLLFLAGGTGYIVMTQRHHREVLAALETTRRERENSIAAAKIVFQALKNVYWEKEELRNHPELRKGLKEVFGQLHRLGVMDALFQGGDEDGILCIYGMVYGTSSDAEEVRRGIEVYTRCIQKNPMKSSAYTNRGFLYMTHKLYAQAEQDFTKAVELEPTRAEYYLNRGILYDTMKRREEALQDVNKALELDPASVGAYCHRGSLYNEWERYAEAERDFSKALEIDPSDSMVYFNFGVIYWAQKRYTEAERAYTRAVELEPKYVTAYLNRGNIYRLLKRYAEAERDYNKALALDASLVRGYRERAILFKDQKRYPEAERDYVKALELDPGDALVYSNRGVLYYYQGKYAEAERDYTQSLKLDPRDAATFSNRAALYCEQNRFAEAEKDLIQALQLAPRNVDAWTNQGSVKMQLQQWAQAEECFAKAMALDPAHGKSRYNRAILYYSQRRYAEAEADLVKAAELCPEDPGIFFLLTHIYALRAASFPQDATGNRARKAAVAKALDYLEQAAAKGFTDWHTLQGNMEFEVLRGEPRYQKLVAGH